MDIAALSMDSALSSIQSSISMVTLRTAMNQDANSVQSLIQNMQAATPPPPAVGSVGHLMDIRV